jgi:hypothetical protein
MAQTKKATPSKATPKAPAARKAAPPPNTDGKASWFNKGTEAGNRELERQARNRELMGRTRRFFIPKPTRQEGASKVVILLDDSLDSLISVREHGYFPEKGKPPVFFTCLDGSGAAVCPDCEGRDKTSFTAFLSLFNTSEWTDKQNKAHRNQKELFPMKADQLALFRRMVEKNGGKTRGMVVEVFRTNADKSHPTGDSFEFVEKIDFRSKQHLDKYNLYDDKRKPLDSTPINYLEELKPETEEERRTWLNANGFEGGGAETEDQIPY